MPGNHPGQLPILWGPVLLDDVNNGTVPMSRLNDAVRQVFDQ
jgi:hypothetical protein